MTSDNHQSEHAKKEHTLTTRNESLTIPLAIVFSGLLIAGAIIFSGSGKSAGAQPVAQQLPETGSALPLEEQLKKLAINSDDHVLGNPDAPVVIVEYSDTQCPFCLRFHASMNQAISEYGASGKIAWVHRHWPLEQIHENARSQAHALECANELAGKEAFWKYLDAIFTTEATAVPDLKQLAVAQGIDGNTFVSCQESKKYNARIDKDLAEGAELGVRGTPYTLIVNQKTKKILPVNGALPYPQLKAQIELALTK